MFEKFQFLFVCGFALATSFSVMESNITNLPAIVKDTKIIGGSGVNIEEAPYQVSIRLKSLEKTRGYGGGHICGGSVITQRLVLTAAHCLIMSKNQFTVSRSPKDLLVVMGSVFLRHQNSKNLIYNVQQIVTHKDYNATTLENDIALVFLNGYIPWDWPTVRSISMNTQPIKWKTLCTVSGWGVKDNGMASMTLLAAKVPIIKNSFCSNSYGHLPSTMLCAGYMEGGIDACQGDSGGPLQCNNLLVGIVSWGNGCAEPNHPGIYTNVAAYRNWILSLNNTFNYTDFSTASHLLYDTSKFLVLSSIIMNLFICYLLSS